MKAVLWLVVAVCVALAGSNVYCFKAIKKLEAKTQKLELLTQGIADAAVAKAKVDAEAKAKADAKAKAKSAKAKPAVKPVAKPAIKQAPQTPIAKITEAVKKTLQEEKVVAPVVVPVAPKVVAAPKAKFAPRKDRA
jgi:hypothetical protein